MDALREQERVITAGLGADLADRLSQCALRVGGKKALATLVGVSEASLYRYMNGESEMSAATLLAVANAAQVDAGWLLTGQARQSADGRPPFRPALLVNLIEQFEILLTEYEKPFSPRQRALALQYMYDALRHEERLRGYDMQLTRTEMIGYVNFLCDLRTDMQLGGLQKAFEWLELGRGKMTDYEYAELVSLVARGYAYFYNSQAGQAYFDRATTSLSEKSIARLHRLLGMLQTGNKPLRMLDLACGNGRELSYVWRQDMTRHVHGVELSERGVKLAKQLEQSGRLPVGAVQQGDMRMVPFGDASFELINCRASLSCLPYIADVEVGLMEVLREVRRVLVPGGMMSGLTMYGQGREWLPFSQLHNEVSIAQAAAAAGLEVRHMERLNVRPLSRGGNMLDYPSKYDDNLDFVLVKPV